MDMFEDRKERSAPQSRPDKSSPQKSAAVQKATPVVLCASNAYNRKYYLNENFKDLPSAIKEELQIMCVLYTEDVGGVLQLAFDEDGCLQFETSYEENDFFYDEIGSVLKIKQYQNNKRELLEELETYYRIVFLGEGLEEE